MVNRLNHWPISIQVVMVVCILARKDLDIPDQEFGGAFILPRKCGRIEDFIPIWMDRQCLKLLQL